MNHLDKIYGFKPLQVDAVYELVKDMCNEDESFNPRKSKYRTAMAMFLRRYCYLPKIHSLSTGDRTLPR